MNLISNLVLFTSLFNILEAHVIANPSVAAPGSYFVSKFIVPHGCNGSQTLNVTITIPNIITSVTPEAVPGWNITLDYITLLNPIPQDNGSFLNKTIRSVSYTGGQFPANQYTEFGLSFKLPANADSNNTLYFPTYQMCANGSNLSIGTPNNNVTEKTANLAPKIQLCNNTSSGIGKGSGESVITPSSLVLIFALFTLLSLL